MRRRDRWSRQSSTLSAFSGWSEVRVLIRASHGLLALRCLSRHFFLRRPPSLPCKFTFATGIVFSGAVAAVSPKLCRPLYGTKAGVRRARARCARGRTFLSPTVNTAPSRDPPGPRPKGHFTHCTCSMLSCIERSCAARAQSTPLASDYCTLSTS